MITFACLKKIDMVQLKQGCMQVKVEYFNPIFLQGTLKSARHPVIHKNKSVQLRETIDILQTRPLEMTSRHHDTSKWCSR